MSFQRAQGYARTPGDKLGITYFILLFQITISISVSGDMLISILGMSSEKSHKLS